MSYEEYLAFEGGNDLRSEFLHGWIVPMAAQWKVHDEVAGSLIFAIHAHLRRRGPCRVHQAGIPVRVDAADCIFYPDLHVTCDSRDHQDPNVTRHPSLVIEILSPSTRDFDRGDKFSAYKALDSLQEYVLVDSQAQSVSVFRRIGGGRWVNMTCCRPIRSSSKRST